MPDTWPPSASQSEWSIEPFGFTPVSAEPPTPAPPEIKTWVCCLWLGSKFEYPAYGPFSTKPKPPNDNVRVVPWRATFAQTPIHPPNPMTTWFAKLLAVVYALDVALMMVLTISNGDGPQFFLHGLPNTTGPPLKPSGSVALSGLSLVNTYG